MHLEGEVYVVDESLDPPEAVLCTYHIVRQITWGEDGLCGNVQSYYDEDDWLLRGLNGPRGNSSFKVANWHPVPVTGSDPLDKYFADLLVGGPQAPASWLAVTVVS